MRFYHHSHRFYCGIDLHARLLAICVLDHAGTIVLQTQIPASQQLLLDTLAPYRPDVVVAVECLFACYWVADLCQAHHIPFVLGHALYMKAIHGGKSRIPPYFDASMFLTSHALIGRPYALRGNYLSRVASAGRSLARKRPCDDGPPLEPIPNWEDRMPA